MLKKEFIESLNQKLALINDKEREDILLEYGSYIDDKMANGVSEEEAVAGFGDLDVLAKEILDAYKINTDSMDPLSCKTDKTMDKIYEKVEVFFSKIGHFSMNDIFHIIFDSILLILILGLSKLILVDCLCYIALSFAFSIFGGLYEITEFLMKLCDILYLCLAIYYFITIMAKRVNRYRAKTVQQGVVEDIKEKWNDNLKSDDLPPIPLYHERNVKSTHTESLVFKVILVFAIFPITCIFMGSVICFFVMLYVSFSFQTTSIGLYCMDLGFVLGSLMILILLFHAWPKVKESNHA